ncbi:M4 family metallopeptidase [uncultured Psychroserpens sp.]|uniref:M4 family metallopeptidase n=1 Tax=uncultured Psychroserpens sp. TaxID=255436 RepID=UPI0026230BC4|nr:M4 family metallopeptidase [uncultured Psychroserpens sp.]
MKKSHSLIWLLQLVTLCIFAQNKIDSSVVKSKFVNEKGIAQFVTFDKASKLNFGNRSDLFKEFFETPKHTRFVKTDTKTDKIGFLHETFQQYYNAIPVEFGIYKTHIKNETISAINGDYFPIRDINTTPSISEAKAISIAKSHVKASYNYDQSMNALGYEGPNPTLVVFPKMKHINAVDRLAFKLDIYAEKPLYHADVYVDAHTGELIFENNKIQHSNQPANGTTLYNGTQNFTADSFSGGYRLRQTTPQGTEIQTFDATSGVQNATDIISATSTFNTNAAAVQAHWGTEQAYEYYRQMHNRISFDGNGALIKSYITPQSPDGYASWTGSVMHYSMGYGSTFGPLTSLDIVGHEYTHAVIDYSADLIFSYESGAINESFADIFGEMVENYAQGSNDWLCGDDVFTGGARSMSNPKSKGHPDTYQGQYWQTSSSDNFGVHTNSGVLNKWFYLLAAGGSGINDNNLNYSVNGIGIQNAADIVYRALTVYITPTTDFFQVRNLLVHAAYDLYGQYSTEALATIEALKAVGLVVQQTDYLSPTAPLNLVSSNATQYVIPLSWDASTDNVGVLGYTILLEGSINKSWSTPNTSFTAQGTGVYLEPNTNNEFKVVAFDAAGNLSQYSNTVNVFFDTLAPTSPTNLTSSNTTQNTTELSWTASTDNYGVTGYKIYQNYEGNTTEIPVTGTSYTVTGLTENSNYSFYVKAIDAAGNESNPSNTVNVTTLMSSCLGGNGNLSLTINLDYGLGSAISWTIKDATTFTVVDSGSAYPDDPSYSSYTIVENITLSPGTYIFDILDSAWGNSFELKNNSNQVITSAADTTSYFPNPFPFSFCVNVSGNREALIPGKLPNSSSELSGIIYPNPVSDRLHFKNLDEGFKTFQIIDLTGKIFIKGMLNSENIIDVSKLKSGLYILRILNKEETDNYKFIKH